MKTFAERFAFALSKSGLSARQCDELMGWRKGWSKRLLESKVPAPPPTANDQLADVLGVNDVWLQWGVVSRSAEKAIAQFEGLLSTSQLSDDEREDFKKLLSMF